LAAALLAAAFGPASADTLAAAPAQLAYLKASNAEAEDYFGGSIALDGETLVVGASNEDGSAAGGEDDNSAPCAGAAYVFTRSGTGWVQQARLKASDAEAGDSFGLSVAIDGDTLVVGAPYEDSIAGAAYVFTRSGTGWSQQARLKASNAEAGDYFGALSCHRQRQPGGGGALRGQQRDRRHGR
jgi:hypothetical protein